MASLTFLGAAGTVTGSQYLVEAQGDRLLVDCGQFQGLKALRLRNWAPLPVDAAAVQAVVLTHAHLDHSGMLPRLVRQGFRGRVFATAGTTDLCTLILKDAGHIQEEEARRANRGHYTKHHPALPLFTEADAAAALARFQVFGYRRDMPVTRNLTAQFHPAGHLLGSAFATLARKDGSAGSVLFGGDLGRYGRPVLPDPAPGVACDVLLVESTYGDRQHPPDDNGAALARVVTETADRQGKLIIPAFAIGRVEEVLYWLRRLEQEGRVPKLPVYVDSPMAVSSIEFYRRHAHELDEDMRPVRGELCRFCTERFEPVETMKESQAVIARPGPAIVISASGMATGGRVLHHLKAMAPEPRHHIVFAGFQVAGSRGARLVGGATEVKIHGQYVPVRATVTHLEGFSGHADSDELMAWLRGFRKAPRQTFVVHGDPEASDALRLRIQEELGWSVRVASHGATVQA